MCSEGWWKLMIWHEVLLYLLPGLYLRSLLTVLAELASWPSASCEASSRIPFSSSYCVRSDEIYEFELHKRLPQWTMNAFNLWLTNRKCVLAKAYVNTPSSLSRLLELPSGQQTRASHFYTLVCKTYVPNLGWIPWKIRGFRSVATKNKGSLLHCPSARQMLQTSHQQQWTLADSSAAASWAAQASSQLIPLADFSVPSLALAPQQSSPGRLKEAALMACPVLQQSWI